jgi:2'-5' RNA ligase
MRRRRLIERPALPRRALAWFPPTDRLSSTEDFRAAHDPRAALLAAHVTLVFPFASSLGAIQIAAHIRRTLANWPMIPVRFEGVGQFHGDWIYRKISRGYDALMELHDRLYRGALASFLRPEIPFEPHLTVARVGDAKACDALLASAAAVFARPDDAVLSALALCALHDNGVVERKVAFALGGA